MIVAALLTAGLSLRLAVASVPPVLDDVRAAEGLGAVATGLLATAPVICFGLGAWATPVVTGAGNLERALMAGLAATAAGIVLRALPGAAPLFAGTLASGAGTAVSNVIAPSLIKREFARPGPMMGAFVLAMSTSAVVAAAATVPIAELTGSWRWGLAVWSLPTVIAAALLLPVAHRGAKDSAAGAAPLGRVPWRSGRAWQLAVFMAAQVMLFYSLLTWLPTIFRDHGMTPTTAGLLLSVMLLVGLPTSFAAPVLAARTENQRLVTILFGALWIAGLIGLAAGPATLPLLWMVILGAGQGGGVGLALTFPVLRSAGERQVAALSGMAQGFGYVAGALGALLLGVVHDATASWKVPLMLLVVVACVLLVSGLLAARPGHIGAAVSTAPGNLVDVAQ